MTSDAPVDRRRAITDVLVQIVGRFGNLALGAVVTIVLVRALGDSSFGQWSTIFAVTQIASNFGELGLEAVAVTKAATDAKRETHWVSALVSLRVVLAVPVTLAAMAVILAISTTEEMRQAGLLICCTILVGAPTALRAAFQLRIRNDVTVWLITVNSVLWAAAVLAIAAADGTMVAFAGAFAAVAAITTVGYVILARRWLRVRPGLGRQFWRELVRVGAVVGAAGLVTTAYVRIDQILVFELAGSREAGLYGAVYRLLDQAQFLPVAAMTTLRPLLAAAHGADLKRAARVFQASVDYLAIASLPVFAFSLVAAEPIVTLLFGEEFAEAAAALPILMGTFAVLSLSYPADAMVIILGLQRRFLVFALIALAVNLALNFAFVPEYGFMAAAWATLATELVIMPLTLWIVLPRMEGRLRFGRMLRATVAAAFMAVVVLGLREAGVPLSGLVAAAVLAYLLGLGALRALTVAEVRALLRKEVGQ